MNTSFVCFLKVQKRYLVSFRVLAFTNFEKMGELMVRSLYQKGALTVIKV